MCFATPAYGCQEFQSLMRRRVGSDIGGHFLAFNWILQSHVKGEIRDSTCSSIICVLMMMIKEMDEICSTSFA